MSLDLAGLKAALEDLASSPPATVAGCAEAWADAMALYASDVVPESTSVSSAASALETALVAAFQAEPEDVADDLEEAFADFAAEVISTMDDPVAPPGEVGWADFFEEDHPATHAAAADALGDLIHSWMTTAESDGDPIS